MEDERTPEEFWKDYLKEQRRGTVVAMIRGHSAMEDGATREGLIAEYTAITGLPYKTDAEERAELRAKAAKALIEKKAAKIVDDRAIVDRAVANGFVNAAEIMKSWGDSGEKWYHAYVWIERAGEELVYLLNDGRTAIRKWERTGLYKEAAERVKVAHQKWIDDRRKAEWNANYVKLSKHYDDERVFELIGKDWTWTWDEIKAEAAKVRLSERKRLSRVS